MKAELVDLGHLSYSEATSIQLATLEAVAAGTRPDTLFFVEHDPVLTLGANFHEQNLLLAPDEYARRGISIEKTERGGDVTFHGPNQLVIYPVFNVANHGKDLHRWMRDLEETMLLTLSSLGLEGYRFPPHTGAWVNGRKVAAIGVKIRRWVSMHGIALNCNNDLSTFDLIVPCGIEDFGVTSLSQELVREVTVEEVKPRVVEAFVEVFGLQLG